MRPRQMGPSADENASDETSADGLGSDGTSADENAPDGDLCRWDWTDETSDKPGNGTGFSGSPSHRAALLRLTGFRNLWETRIPELSPISIPEQAREDYTVCGYDFFLTTRRYAG